MTSNFVLFEFNAALVEFDVEFTKFAPVAFISNAAVALFKVLISLRVTLLVRFASLVILAVKLATVNIVVFPLLLLDTLAILTWLTLADMLELRFAVILEVTFADLVMLVDEV